MWPSCAQYDRPLRVQLCVSQSGLQVSGYIPTTNTMAYYQAIQSMLQDSSLPTCAVFVILHDNIFIQACAWLTDDVISRHLVSTSSAPGSTPRNRVYAPADVCTTRPGNPIWTTVCSTGAFKRITWVSCRASDERHEITGRER